MGPKQKAAAKILSKWIMGAKLPRNNEKLFKALDERDCRLVDVEKAIGGSLMHSIASQQIKFLKKLDEVIKSKGKKK